MSKRTTTLISLAAFAAAAAAAPAGAGAATFCVADPECVGTAHLTVTSALQAAGDEPGPDRVEIGAGTYSAPSGFAYLGVPGNEVEIVGAGASTVLTAQPANAPVSVLRLRRGTVSDLRVVVPDAPGADRAVGLRLQHGAAERIAVADDGTTQGDHLGVHLDEGSALRDSSVLLPAEVGDQLGVVADGGDVVIADSHVLGQYAVSGIQASIAVRRSVLEGWHALSAYGGTSTLSDSLLRTGEGAVTVTGVVNDPATLELAGVTVLGGDVYVSADAGASATATLRNTAIDGASPVDVDPGATLTAIDSAFHRAGSDGAITYQAGLDVDPEFADAEGRLPTVSPLRDAGFLAPAQGPLDLDGGARVQGPAVDIGAYELPTLPTVPGGEPAASEPAPPVSGDAPAGDPALGDVAAEAPADTLAPAITKVRRRGRAVRFVLSEPATVTVATKRRTRTVELAAGRQAVRVRGRRARIILQAVDAAGNSSAPLKVRGRR
ncbi:MAG TPA: choice-of-anchor Q domain-containing protein [Capillimicrobium sp.]|jgi:hypothetical protein